MRLAICSLASGSSGNSYLIRSENTNLLVDVGISAKQVKERITDLGLDMHMLSAVLLTHEHSDHTKGLAPLIKNNQIKIYSNKLSLESSGINCSEEQQCLFTTGESFIIGDISVTSFPVSHDAADPVGYYFEKDGAKIAIVTDTGVLTEDARKAIAGSDILVLESNHDINILRMGRYPWFLKQRILSEQGHLSNEAAAEGLCEVLKEEKESGVEKRRIVLLAHLSKENNFPEMALMTMQNILEEKGYNINQDIKIETLPRAERSSIFCI